jgi:putative tryptophan/tyrosine transport system substrate-binding protein
VRRRKFIAGLAGVAAWPLVGQAQQPGRIRRVGVMMEYSNSDLEGRARLAGLMRGLSELGWTNDRNLRVDIRWAAANAGRMRTFAKELLELQPDVLLGGSTAVTAALQQETRRIPIVFAVVSDPIGDRFIDSLARPGGNITGFILMEGSIAGKWLALLSAVAPRIKRASMMFNPEFVAGRGSYYLPPFEAAAQSLNLEPITSRVRSDVEIEAAMTLLAGNPKGGLVFPPDGFVLLHRERIISLAAKSYIPTIFPNSVYVKDGGLLSYGSDQVDIFRRSASYVDRILRGENPADLPVQLPIKFNLAVNLKTAKALGLTIPETLLATADEVIQ